MRVLIPQPLLSYTGGVDLVDAHGETLDELLWDLDRQYRGIRFRMINEQDEMRPHVVFFVRGQKTRDLHEPLAGTSEVVILQALSGG
ncbi:MAG: MoaD/ThiS family protein [Pseudomonadales bacterium]